MSRFSDSNSALQKAIAFGLGERRRMIFACFSLLLVLLVATWIIVNNSQQTIIEFKSRQIANVVATQAKTARSIYSRTVVAKLKNDGFYASTDSDQHVGSVPIPAQFLKTLAHDSAREHQDEFQFRALSKWNLSPDQGLKDEFQKWAWAQLEHQQSGDQVGTVNWQPVWRIENVGGVDALRYLVADPASSQSCVDCHNKMEKTPAILALRETSGVNPGKEWQLNDLMGALEVIVPVHESSSLAAAQTKSGLLLVTVVAIAGIVLVMGISAIDGLRTSAINQRLEYKARSDALTGLPNRSGFEHNVTSLLASENCRLCNHAVLLLDLNDFKRINDTLGHHVGDDVLKEVARRLKTVIKEPSIVARLGGDEFVVFLADASKSVVLDAARSIEHVLHKTVKVGEFRMSASASIGIACMPQDGDELSELLRCADVAMYCAKRGKSGYDFYKKENDHNHINSLSIISDLKSALKNDGLSMLYQPKFDFEQGRICGVEALLRWKHPEYGMISPLRIIPMSEQSDQISSLTYWTVNTSLKQLKHWLTRGYDLKIAVNLSAQMLNSDDTVDMFLGLLDTHNINSDRLIVEVTETTVMYDSDKALQLLNRLRQAGVNLSLDDFGTGYSSLSYVNKLPIHEIKLDRSFITDVSNPKDKAIVKSVIELASNLKLDLVVEGVEDAATLALLLDLNCTQVQGYYLSKPITGTQLTEQWDELTAMAHAWHTRHNSWLNRKAA